MKTEQIIENLISITYDRHFPVDGCKAVNEAIKILSAHDDLKVKCDLLQKENKDLLQRLQHSEKERFYGSNKNIVR